jgi:hypothetical protein
MADEFSFHQSAMSPATIIRIQHDKIERCEDCGMILKDHCVQSHPFKVTKRASQPQPSAGQTEGK